MRVFVYYNLHKKLWSIKALEGEHKGKVIYHRDEVYLSDVVPKVSQAGRNRVLKEQCKNVHAGLVGTLEDEIISNQVAKKVSYNPYFLEHFFYVKDNSEFTGCSEAYLGDKKVWEIRE